MSQMCVNLVLLNQQSEICTVTHDSSSSKGPISSKYTRYWYHLSVGSCGLPAVRHDERMSSMEVWKSNEKEAESSDCRPCRRKTSRTSWSDRRAEQRRKPSQKSKGGQLRSSPSSKKHAHASSENANNRLTTSFKCSSPKGRWREGSTGPSPMTSLRKALPTRREDGCTQRSTEDNTGGQ